MLDNKSVSYFLSSYWRNVPLYAEKIIPLLDTCLSNNYTFSDKVANAFYELTNKYKNTAELPLPILKEFIREQGYGYILDLVVQNEDTIKLLWYMLVLIHQLKGSKEGLLLVLSLLDDNFDPNKTTITQWYEMNPVGRPNTFELSTSVDIAKLGEGFFQNFQTFLANYIYPEMLSLKVNYNVDGRLTYRPYSREKMLWESELSFEYGINCGNSFEILTGLRLYDLGRANSGSYLTPSYLENTTITIEEELVCTPLHKYVTNILIEGTETETQNIECGNSEIEDGE
jgi:hypothetical protein